VNLLADGWYDTHDLRRVAAEAPQTTGAVIVFLPQDPPASARALIRRLPDRLTIEGIERQAEATTLLHASDADDEVRCMVRRVVTALRSTPAHQIAILYGTAHPYARLLAEHLDAAGIRRNGNGVSPTIERRLARVVRGLFAVHQTNWRRANVLTMLADVTGTAAWDRVSRAAGVVGGDDWEVRLKAYAAQERAADRTWNAEPADELRTRVTDLQTRMREGDGLTTWPALAEWGRQTYTALVGDLDDLRVPEDEQRAAVAVTRTLDAVSGLDTVEPAADLTLLDLTLDLQLSGDLPRHGRIGDGVLVAPLSAAIGLDADEVFVLGLSEDLVPGRIGVDALLPDEVRVLGGGQLPMANERIERRRRHTLAAFAAAPTVTASYARGDLRRSTERIPSRWLATVEATVAPSFATELLHSTELAGEQEWRTRAAAAGTLTGDPVVALARQMREARNSDLLTRFDGDLSGHVLPDPTDGSVISPTALEAWARCPHSYFVQKLLGVRPLETPEEQVTITPIDLGNVYHHVLDRFFAEQDARGAVPGGGTPWTVAQRADLRRVALEVAQDFSVRGQTGHRLLWRHELNGVLTRLDRFLDADEQVRANTGRRQVRSELAFGFRDEPAVPVPLPDGRLLLMKGSADRVDRAGDTIVVVDYKSGSTHAFKNLGEDHPTLGGAKLQLPVYGLAARLALGAPDADVTAEYWFLHKDAGRRIELPLTEAVEAEFTAAVTVIADGIAGGLFPHRPPDDDGWGNHIPCQYCDPDGLGAGDHRERWDRKRTDPRLAGYVAMIEGAP
jgi:RecB family exonuclease